MSATKNISDFLIENDHDYSILLLTKDLKNTYEHLGLLTTLNYIDIIELYKKHIKINEVDLNSSDDKDNFEEGGEESYEDTIL